MVVDFIDKGCCRHGGIGWYKGMQGKCASMTNFDYDKVRQYQEILAFGTKRHVRH